MHTTDQLEKLYGHHEHRTLIQHILPKLPESTILAIETLRYCRLALLMKGDRWDKILSYKIEEALIAGGVTVEKAQQIDRSLQPLLETQESIDCTFLENLELRLCKAAIARANTHASL